MRASYIDEIDLTPRPLIALGRVYPDGFDIEPHQHRRDQLMSATSGLIVLTTLSGTWIIPPQRGMWIPATTQHRVRMVGAVRMQSLYVEPGAIPNSPTQCQVVAISTFVRELIGEAAKLPPEYELEGRTGTLMQLLQHELSRLSPLPLALRYPSEGPLAKRCQAFVLAPNIHETTDDWSQSLGMSRRSFTRHFRRETGMSFQVWCQQACLLSAMPRLAEGEAVTHVALDLGYENPAAFSTMFKRAFGSPPLAYLGVRSRR